MLSGTTENRLLKNGTYKIAPKKVTVSKSERFSNLLSNNSVPDKVELSDFDG